jgi:predicted DNA-binding protein YlxM (UPF0122 family)
MRLFTFIINVKDNDNIENDTMDNDTKKRLRQIEKKLDMILAENTKLKQEIYDKLEESIDDINSTV